MAKKIKIEDYEKEVSNKKKTKDKLKICSLIVNGILGFCLIISIVMYVSFYSKSSSKFEETPDSEKKWVAIPYDCMMKKVNGNFTYWAYNKDAAISEGLKAGGC